MPASAQTATDPLSLRLAALADPTRRAMLVHLARRGPTPATELGQPFAMTQPAISKHLKVLERAGLISRSRSAQFRPCRLEPLALGPVQDWIADLKRETEAQLDRLEAYLEQLQSAATAAVPGSAIPQPPNPQSEDKP